jgi:hypothetical protein
MPITPYLGNSSFQPELIDSMGVALVNSCRSLGLVDRTDPATKLVAEKIIELARNGETDAHGLYNGAMKFFEAEKREYETQQRAS